MIRNDQCITTNVRTSIANMYAIGIPGARWIGIYEQRPRLHEIPQELHCHHTRQIEAMDRF